MTHLVCPKCGSNEHTAGYGLAAGPMGSYTFCDGCDILLEASPDLQGMEDEKEDCKKIVENLQKHMKFVWGDSWELPNHLKEYI